jgi:hypothetical protein
VDARKSSAPSLSDRIPTVHADLDGYFPSDRRGQFHSSPGELFGSEVPMNKVLITTYRDFAARQGGGTSLSVIVVDFPTVEEADAAVKKINGNRSMPMFDQVALRIS